MSRPTLLLVAVLALAGCSDKVVETETADASSSVTVDVSDDDTVSDVTVEGDAGSGQVEINLPGGIGAKVTVPKSALRDAKFDIAGVGLYPGATLGAFAVNADTDKGKRDATVDIGFTAPADAAAVADWYQQQFEAKKIAVSRSGETLSGKTDDGDDFTLALSPAATGSAGKLTIRDAG